MNKKTIFEKPKVFLTIPILFLLAITIYFVYSGLVGFFHDIETLPENSLVPFGAATYLFLVFVFAAFSIVEIILLVFRKSIGLYFGIFVFLFHIAWIYSNISRDLVHEFTFMDVSEYLIIALKLIVLGIASVQIPILFIATKYNQLK